MEKISRGKIERASINYLSDIINSEPLLEEDFPTKDKEMSYDGNIYILKNEGELSKHNLFGTVPVQIKGHIDKKQKYIGKSKISYKVSIEDLKVYFKDKGVLYFQVFMSEDREKKEVFYTSLFPTKIKKYLNAIKKQEQKDLHIKFYKLNKQNIYSIVRQFYSETKRQGLGEGQIVSNTLSYKDMGQMDSFKFNVAQAKDIFDVLEQMEEGNISLYGVKNDSNLEFPIEWIEMSECCAKTKVKQNIKIGDKVFYNEYEVEFGSNRDIVLILSENLKISTKEKEIQFKVIGSLDTIENDMKFLYEMISNSRFEIFDEKYFEYGEVNFTKQMLGIMNDLKALCAILDNIGLKEQKKNIKLQNEKEYLIDLLKLVNKEFIELSGENFVIENWKIAKKYFPIFILLKTGEKNELFNIISKNVKVYITDSEGKKHQINIIEKIEQEVLNNLYYYDYEKMHELIDSLKVSDFTYDIFNAVVLKLINVYDYRKNKEILYVAKHQLYKIGQFRNDDIYKINDIQIKKRLNIMSEEDIKYLKKISKNETQNDILFAVNTLLENKALAQKNYRAIDKERKKCIREYPIYTLYKKLIQNTKK